MVRSHLALVAAVLFILGTCVQAHAQDFGRSSEIDSSWQDRDVLPPEPHGGVNDCEQASTVSNRFKSLGDIKVALEPTADQVPPDCSQFVFDGRVGATTWSNSVAELNWEPTNFFHHPLYFDDTPLERYGQTVCSPAQPWISGAKFFLNFPVIPYKIGVDHTHDCITTLGLYRPGSCAPCVREVLLRGDRQAALLQAATTVGLVLLLP